MEKFYTWETLMERHTTDPLSILVIDDDPFTQELTKAMLKKAPNTQLFQAFNAQEGLDTMLTHSIDLLLLDFYMPHINGREFLKILRRHETLAETPVVLITTDRITREEVQQLGVKSCIHKPFDFQNFVQQVLENVQVSD
ncbi:MAG TPA: response regulator [Campylobacterales bacterium]|nr:response regulator [Campylobacterales bacterium]